MTIKELEERTGLSRANIRFYEKEGLLSPLRRENGYREYTEEDVQTLQRIKLLRSLQFSIEEIRTLQNKSSSLSDVMAIHLQKLTQSKKELEQVESICRAIHRDQVEFEQLNAPYYWKKLNEKSEYNPAPLLEDKEPLPANPWRRLFARLFDEGLYQVLWMVVLFAGVKISPLTYWNNQSLCDLTTFVLGIATMVAVEPLWLRFVGTTPGKFLFGLRFTEKMPYRIGLRRTIDVIRYGQGWFVPIYHLVCLWQAYWRVDYGEVARWDEGMSYVDAKPWRWYKVIVPIAGHAALLGLLLVSLLLGRMAPNRGELTIAEFSENYNFYADYYQLSGEYYLDENGKWYEELVTEAGFVIVTTYPPGIPDGLYFEMDGDSVEGISFVRPAEKGSTGFGRVQCLALALISAQPEAGLFSGAVDQVFEHTDGYTLGAHSHFEYEDCGVSIKCRGSLDEWCKMEIRLEK